MTKHILHIIFATLTLMLGLTSCEDQLDYLRRDIPEGMSEVEINLGFKEFTPALESRTAGDAIENIHTLWLVLYNTTDGTPAWAGEIKDFDYYPSKERNREDAKRHTPTGHVGFTVTLPNGRFRMYAVANKALSPDDYKTESDLKNLQLTWDFNNINNNAEMFGWFVNGDNTTLRSEGFDATPVEIAGNDTKLHAWLKRAASKVTVAYDGSRLSPGVSIFLKSVSLKHVPMTSKLGAKNTIEDPALLADGESVTYTTSTTHDANYPALVSKEQPLYPRPTEPDAHAANSPNSLFFYENMQGTGPDKRQKDEDGDGVPDNTYGEFDSMPCGTYIEVDAYYISKDPEKPGSGNIKYRFMLGKDIISDYDAERNFHYKLTMIFKSHANDPDWHIDFSEQKLEVSEPSKLNYQGKYFRSATDLGWGWIPANEGFYFSDENVITISSCLENLTTGEKEDLPYTITYTYTDEKGNKVTANAEAPSWLHVGEIEDDPKNPQPSYMHYLSVKADQIEGETFKINEKLSKATKKGSKTAPCNLADPKSGDSYSTTFATKADAKNTANTYMVDAGGWYIIPLVYGNARKGGADNTEAYQPSDVSGADYLANFKDHLDNNITKPFIKENNSGKCTPAKAQMIWEDESGLLTNLEYVASAYGSTGGLRFQIPTGKQGNAVIAILDDKNRVMWSWQIWVTRFDFDKEIRLLNHDKDEFYVMPVNLGWCSLPDEEITYYPARECTMTITAGEITKEIVISEASHTAFTRGTTPHYQWGRKDPFPGGGLSQWANKEIFNFYGRPDGTSHPPRLTNDTEYKPLLKPDGSTAVDSIGNEIWIPAHDDERLTTRKALGTLIQKPQTWHNPPRREPGEGWRKFRSKNETYYNLWGGHVLDGGKSIKTVYDPCPYGYSVGSKAVYSGFSATGLDLSWFYEGNDVDITNQPTNHPSRYLDGVMEFYTTPDKLQSIVFPMAGYRDYDDLATVYNYMAPAASDNRGFVWSNQLTRVTPAADNTPAKAYYFEFAGDKQPYTVEPIRFLFIGVNSHLYMCNGYCVRPCKE